MENSKQPISPLENNHTGEMLFGLTKREYFAGLVMQGFITRNCDYPFEVIAKWSVEQADELLKQLENEE